jgi:[ribosomal protein S18]-alanine N-acetyltransferase
MIDPIADIRIRRMAVSDLDRILEIAGSSPHAPRWPRSIYESALSPNSTPRRISLVASRVPSKSGTIVGFAIASLLPPQAELESIVAAPKCRRHGLGRRLFGTLAQELIQAGVRDFFLEVRVSNQPALAFYRSLGFVQTGLRPRYYVDPVEDAFQMRLLLGADPH